MNWQNRNPGWMSAQSFNQMQYQNQAQFAAGLNGWAPQTPQQMNFGQNMVRAGQYPFYNNNGRQVPMNQTLTAHAAQPFRVDRKRTFQQRGQQQTQQHPQQFQPHQQHQQQAQRFQQHQRNQQHQQQSQNKRQKLDASQSDPQQHTRFMSIKEAPDTLTYEEKLSLVIWNNFTNNRQSVETFKKKGAVRSTLCSIFEHVLGKNCVHIVGSTLNGFGSEKSDCDMCLHITSRENGLTKRTTQALLTAIQRSLRGVFNNVQFIPARVPILKFRDRYSNIECDLNVNNTAGILNTRLLALYSAFDWRVRPLGMFVKHWGRLCDIHDASRGRLSSYAFNLMVIQYLQHGCKPPVLPSLQKDFSCLFEKHDNVHRLDMSLKDLEPLKERWQRQNPENTQSLGELFIGFIHYFNHHINFSQHAMSIRLGRPIPIGMAIEQMPDEEANKIRTGNYNYKIYIEEPFTLLNAARSPYEDSVFAIVLRAFKKTHRFLKTRKDICDIGPV